MNADAPRRTRRRRSAVAAAAVLAALAPFATLACKQSDALAPPREPERRYNDPLTAEWLAAATAGAAGGAAIPRERIALLGALPERFDSPANPLTPEKIALGKQLFFDKRLSKNHDLSCNSCHDLARFGQDGLPVSPGHKKQLGARNSPTVHNAAGQFVQFWDGRAGDVEEQAKGPILNPVEMAMPSAAKVEEVLRSIPGYVEAFRRAFPGEGEPVTYDNLGRAIGAFERTLATPARWDRFARGDQRALSAAEKRGFETFVSTGCTTCHVGPLAGGTLYQKLGLVKAWPDPKDQGRFEHTKQPADKLMFKVPILRNVEHTAPYFHDGSVKTLPEAVQLMARHQLGKELTDAEVNDIVAFLKTLSGQPPKGVAKAPALPPSGPTTPKPDPT